MMHASRDFQANVSKPFGVHVLSEFIFCERAGLNAFLDSSEDVGLEASILRLDFQPNYELEELERELNELAQTIWHIAGALAVSFVCGLLLGRFVHGLFYLAGLLGIVAVVRLFLSEIPRWRRLMLEQRAVRRAVADEPNPQLPQDERIDWWDLRAAGYVSSPCSEMLVDEDVGIQGRPWRILRRGDLTIPAYVRQSQKRITDQQRARIAAYCRLIENHEGGKAPFGLILDAGTFTGTAVKQTRSDLKLIRSALQKIPLTFKEYLKRGRVPPLPILETQCSKCPHGEPRVYEPRVSETTSLGSPVNAFLSKSSVTGKKYHSPCGDRFGWVPNHAEATRLNFDRQ